MNAKDYIQKYKDEELLITVNFEGSLMVSEDKLIEIMEEYAKLKLLDIPIITQRSENLSDFLYINRFNYIAIG